jgi:hypothetical protein
MVITGSTFKDPTTGMEFVFVKGGFRLAISGR